MASDGWIVKFSPFASSVESSFWVRYCKEKLETIRLSEEPIDIVGLYGIDAAPSSSTHPPRLECRETSLRAQKSPNDRMAVKGVLMGYNTVETFQKTDKNQLLRTNFVPRFLSGNLDCLTSLVLLTYADLKNHKVLYWFAVPALVTKPGRSIRALQQDVLIDVWSSSQREKLRESFTELRRAACPSYFLFGTNDQQQSCLEFTKENYEKLLQIDKDGVLFGFVDPCAGAPFRPEQPMGWPMRNLVAYLCFHLGLGGKTVSVVSYRPGRLRRGGDNEGDENDANSLLLRVRVPTIEDYGGDDLKAVGWEANARGKPGPRWVNLRPLLDSHHLAVQAADLNLKLMKWRMIPKLDVDRLQSTKVLLLGAGTLGCNVARVLLGWGIRDFTFVDYGKVSYSNPVRQSLFTLKDCEDGGRPKAVAAAESLKSIAADVRSEGVVLSIPMPGHAEDPSTLEASLNKLEELVERSDVVYLLTDTRESRWIPTVMATAHNKMLINAALGLDSWLVMRHGGGLGCYFCNDVVAPENSMRNRTLDQQCTVTRPGLALIASAMAVELMVSLLHHPLGHGAPAPGRSNSSFSPAVKDTGDNSSSPLGVMPHQIRGSLVSYTMMTPSVPAFSNCTGCSPSVVEAYQSNKVGLMHQVSQSNDGTFLEDLSGLTAFRADAAAKLDSMEGDEWDMEE